MTGFSHTLICEVLGVDKLNPTIIYQWSKSRGQFVVNLSTNLSFHSLRLSDAGEYACQVIVKSPYLHSNVTAVASYSLVLECKIIIVCVEIQLLLLYHCNTDIL